jgi:hypothetical protein
MLFEEILGEPDQSREDDRDEPDDKDKEKDDDEETLTDTKSADEMNTVAGVGLTGPMTPLGTDSTGGVGSPSDYLRGKKKKKKKRKKRK